MASASASREVEAFKRTYDAFLANSQLCRQVLDEQPSADQTLDDLRMNAGFYLKQVRVTHETLGAAARNLKPSEEVLLAPMLAEARRHRMQLLQLVEQWEAAHGTVPDPLELSAGGTTSPRTGRTEPATDHWKDWKAGQPGGSAPGGATEEKASAAAPIEGQPLQVIRLDMRKNQVVPVRENLEIIKEKLVKKGCEDVAIIAIMGAYRTGKSFILDLFLRYLRYAESQGGITSCEPANRAACLGRPAAVPAWLGGNTFITEGSSEQESGGFRWRAGMDKCTEGIWIWSEPFKLSPESRTGVLIMDTQGAWDSRMTKEQSATVFGLTALFSSNLIYNIQSRIQEDKLDNLDYFTTFAKAVAADLESTISTLGAEGEPFVGMDLEEIRFQGLDFLIRDWEHFDDGFSIDKCEKQVFDHLDRHMNVSYLQHDPQRCDAVSRLHDMFKPITIWALPHPGRDIPKGNWRGAVVDLDLDFVKLLHSYCDRLFDPSGVTPTKIFGQALQAKNFVDVFALFTETFKDARPDPTSLRGAFVLCEVLKLKEKTQQEFRAALYAVGDGGVVMREELEQALKKQCAEALAQFKKKLECYAIPDMEEHVGQMQSLFDEAIKARLEANEKEVKFAQAKAAVAAVACGCGGLPLLSSAMSMHAGTMAGVVVGGGAAHNYVNYDEKTGCFAAAAKTKDDVARFLRSVLIELKSCYIGAKAFSAG